MNRTLIVKAFLLPALLALAAGCALPLSAPAATPDATLDALSAAVAASATAAQQKGSGADSLATAQAEGTEKAIAVQATQTARAAAQSQGQQAQATVAAPILAELPQYGLDPAAGRVGWVHDPLTLEITGYTQTAFGNDHPEVTAADFALAADLTWDTQYGSSGCGFMFRSDGNQKKPSGYMALLSRFGNGNLLFTALAAGEIANVHRFYPLDQDNAFRFQNKTTNRVAVVARGNILTFYTNYVKVGEVDVTQPPAPLPSPPRPLPPVDPTNLDAANAYKAQIAEYSDIIKRDQADYQSALSQYSARKAVYTQGFLGFVAASESGRTVCKFEKAWLWLITP